MAYGVMVFVGCDRSSEGEGQATSGSGVSRRPGRSLPWRLWRGAASRLLQRHSRGPLPQLSEEQPG
jgi:hypothetical protein